MYVGDFYRGGDTGVASQLSSVDIETVLCTLIKALDQAGSDADISMEEGIPSLSLTPTLFLSPLPLPLSHTCTFFLTPLSPLSSLISLP
jgi:hypothetical protein